MLKILQYIETTLSSHGRNDRIAKQVLASLIIVIASTLLRMSLPFPILPYLLFIPGIVASGILFGMLSGLLSVGLSTLSAIYFFLPPDRSFVIQDFAQGMSVLLFVIVTAGIALVCSTLRATLLGQEQRIAQALADRMKIEDALRQSQKMEAVGQLTGGLAHDLNNMNLAISGSLELMRRNVARQQYQKLDRFLTTAEHAVRSASDLTARLLAFSRKTTLDPKVIDVVALVRDFEPILRRTLPTVAIDIISEGCCPVLVDPSQLENALLNLCLNARDAMLHVSAGTIRISIENEAGDVKLTVADTGVGMSPETVERAFEPFYTTKTIGLGTGLGLSMVYGFARQSEGSVRIASKLGEGTLVSVLIPRHHSEPTIVTSYHVAPSIEHTGKILLVDDDDGVRVVLQSALEDIGYDVLTAKDGAEGLDIMQNGDVDLIVTDVLMPRMDGPTMARKIRALHPALPIVFVTGYSANLLTDGDLLDDRMTIMAKPFEIDDLGERVRTMMTVDHRPDSRI